MTIVDDLRMAPSRVEDTPCAHPGSGHPHQQRQQRRSPDVAALIRGHADHGSVACAPGALNNRRPLRSSASSMPAVFLGPRPRGSTPASCSRLDATGCSSALMITAASLSTMRGADALRRAPDRVPGVDDRAPSGPCSCRVASSGIARMRFRRAAPCARIAPDWACGITVGVASNGIGSRRRTRIGRRRRRAAIRGMR